MAKHEKMPKNRHTMQNITLCISTSLVLILLGLMVMSSLTARQLSRYVRENLIVTVILNENASVNDGHKMCRNLWHTPYARSVDYVGKDEALKEQTKAMGADPSEFLEGVNPFPASLEVQLKSEYANRDSLKWIESELKKDSLVTEVTYMEDLMDQVNSTLRKASVVMLVLAVLLLIICFSLINNSVRLSVLSRRFSIHTMKLVGASWSIIRRPFVRRAVLLGILAALIAIGVLAALVWVLYQNDTNLLNILTWKELAATAAAVLVFGIIITSVCSYVSVGKFLRMKAGELYKY